MNSKVSIVKCCDYTPVLVQEATRQAIDSLGGITNFIKPGSKVLVKPNLLMAKEPEFGITTHPEVLRAVLRMLKEISCKVIVGDGPSVWGNQIQDVWQVYELTGTRKVCSEEGVELVEFNKRRMRKKFPLSAWLDQCDALISLPKFKTHDLTILTGAVKNLFGLVTGTYKTELHKNYFKRSDFAKILVDIYQETMPALTIIDAVVAMEGDGPASSGKLRDVGLVLAGSDCVALDSVLAKIMGLQPLDILTNKEAASRGLGIADLSSIDIMGEALSNVVVKDFLLPSTSFKTKVPQPIVNIAKKLIKYYPCVEQDNCIKCAACIDACPVKAISMKKDRIVFDYAKCMACFCCQEACPNSAVKVKKSLVAKMIGL